MLTWFISLQFVDKELERLSSNYIGPEYKQSFTNHISEQHCLEETYKELNTTVNTVLYSTSDPQEIFHIS